MADDDFVYFKNLDIYNGDPTYSLEDAIIKCVGLGTIHDFDFQDEINEESTSDVSYTDVPNSFADSVMAQSFTLSDSGTLTNLSIKGEDYDIANVTVTLRSGENLTGAVLATSTGIVDLGGSGVRWFRITLDSSPSLSAGQYTIRIDQAPGPDAYWSYNATGAYSGGMMYNNSSWQAGEDAGFAVYLSSSNFDISGAEGAWGYVEDKLSGTGGGASRWYRIDHDTAIAPSFVATFDKDDARGAFVFCDGHCAYWNSTEVGIGEIDSNGDLTILAKQLHSSTTTATVTVAVRYQALTDYETVDWLSATVYFDGRLMVSGSDYVKDETFTNTVGFAVYESDTITFDNFNIQELRRIVEWTSVDPAEPCSSGMSRAIGTTNVFYFCRFDGAFRCWIPGDRSVDWTVPTTRELRRPTKRNCFVPARARMLGAYHEADSWEDDLAEQQGRPTFVSLNDPNVSDQEETKDSAEDGHRRAREGENEWSVQMPGNPLTEPQDRLSINSNDVRVVGIGHTISKRGTGAPVFILQVDGTDYIVEGA